MLPDQMYRGTSGSVSKRQFRKVTFSPIQLNVPPSISFSNKSHRFYVFDREYLGSPV